jgi:mono/diheme cytochrome c family protein
MNDGAPRPQAEFDFRDLVRHPEKLFGYGYLYFLGAALLIGILYVGNISTIGKRSTSPIVPRDSSAFQKDIPFQSPSVLPPVNVLTAGVPSDSLLERGAGLYRANCSSCHGDNGLGDGPAGLTLNPRPRNFHVLSGWTNGSKVAQIYRTLEEGIVRNGMAAYNYLPPVDRFALAHVVRSFAQGHPADTPEDLQALETTYQLSKGRVSPGQIPVKRATAIILAADQPRSERLAVLVEAVRTDSGAGAGIFRRVAAEPAVVLARFAPGGQPPDVRRFVESVEKDPLMAGFRASVVHLRPEEWTELHRYLVGRAGGVEG